MSRLRVSQGDVADHVLGIVGPVLLAGGFAITALIYAPVLWLAVLSVSDNPLSGLAGGFTTRWYDQLVLDQSWRLPMLRSLQVAVAVSALCVIGAVLIGRTLPRLRRGRALLAVLFLLPLGVPGTVMGLLIFIYYRFVFGLHMGYWSLVLSHFIWAFPFALIGMLVATSRFDTTLLEAAADLGAPAWRVLWDIERPLLMPGIISAGLFGFLLSFTELARSIFVGGALQTLPLYTWAEASSHTSHVPLIFCLNTLITLLSVGASVITILLLVRAARR